jgi:hypothetical protein
MDAVSVGSVEIGSDEARLVLVFPGWHWMSYTGSLRRPLSLRSLRVRPRRRQQELPLRAAGLARRTPWP